MFEDLLPENINGISYFCPMASIKFILILFLFVKVFATTASNSEESSYACYYDDKIGAYLGDLYSVNWMEDSDRVRNQTL